MSDTSSILGMPYIQPSQAQKHVTHNEAIRMLDALVQLSVIKRTRTSPPASFSEGDRYIVPTGATGAWAGQDYKLAVATNQVWKVYTPREGWIAYVEDEALAVAFNGGAWVELPKGLEASDLQNLAQIGINTGADAGNRLSVASDATLLTHDGGDHRLKINKAGNTDTASLLFQSNWTGHAEMGLTGGKDFTIRVSADGGTFVDALSADAATGRLRAPAGVTFGQQTLRNYQQGSWTPRLAFGGDETGMAYAKQEGQFTRIGNLVTLQGAITLTAKGSGTGSAEIMGLPLVPDPVGFPGQVLFSGGGSSLAAPVCQTRTGSRIGLLKTSASGSSDLTQANFGNGTSFAISLTYFV